MKQFNNRYEAIKEFRNYQPINEEVVDFWTKYNWGKWKMGDWVLIQYINCREKQISRPIYGMFVDFTIWDQALVVHIIEKQRAMRWHTDILTNPELDITMRLGELDPNLMRVKHL